MDEKELNILIQMDSHKETIHWKYWPIMCLSIMWKILNTYLRKEIYYSLYAAEIPIRTDIMMWGNEVKRPSYMYTSAHLQDGHNKEEKFCHYMDR